MQHALGRGVVVALIASLTIVATTTPSGAATLPSGFAETTIGGLSTPTAMAFAPDGRLFVAEKGGRLRVVKGGVLLAHPFVTMTVDSAGERGLIGVTLAPDFPTTNRVYIHYTVPGVNGGAAHNRVSWFAASGDVSSGAEHVIVDLPNLGASNHNGGALHFGSDGQLYISVGENAVSGNSQTLSTPLGKLLRVTPNGAPSAGNPFADGSGPHDDRVYAYGLRNPFTFAVQPGTGTMYINDVGSSGNGACGTGVWEEIDVVAAGRNFGWNQVEGPELPACPQASRGYTAPLYTYPHTDPTAPCAITGGDFYNPAAPALLGYGYVGAYFFADNCAGWIHVRMPDGTVSDFATGTRGPVDIDTGPDGALWYLSLAGGYVGRITQTPQPKTLFLRNSASTGSSNLTFQYGESNQKFLFCDWDGNGTDTPGSFRNGTWFLRNTNTAGLADVIVRFGTSGDIPICGKWNGGPAGTPDTIGVYRPSDQTFYLRNKNSSGFPATAVTFGQPGDRPVVGDWNGDGTDTIGVYHGDHFQLRNSNTAGPADIDAQYGASTDVPLVGDWDGDGTDTIGVRHNLKFQLRNTNTAGLPDISSSYGTGTDLPSKGDFDRSGTVNRGDGVALIR